MIPDRPRPRPRRCAALAPIWRGMCLAGLTLTADLSAADWPQFLGPDRNGVSHESIRPTLPAGGPPLQWSVKLGTGWSGPVVVGDQVLIHHRQGGEELLESLDAGTGKSRWKNAQPTGYEDDFGFDNGPRGTPCVSGQRVYTFGAEGRLTAVSLTDGQTVWSQPLGANLHARKGFFGWACSPLVISNRVVLQLGGADGAGIVALNESDGQLTWKATSDEAGYAAPVTLVLGGRTRIAAFNREGLVLLDAATGKVEQRHPWRSRMQASVNAATPVVFGDRVLLSASYDTGATFLNVAGAEPKTLWSGDDAISSHYASLVPADGLVFGYHGRAESRPVFRCVDVATGKVRWTEASGGGGSVLRAENTLILLRDSGELQLAPVSGESFKPGDRHQILGAQTRAVPALSRGVLYARDRTKLVAVKLGE